MHSLAASDRRVEE